MGNFLKEQTLKIMQALSLQEFLANISDLECDLGTNDLCCYLGGLVLIYENISNVPHILNNLCPTSANSFNSKEL